MRIAEGKIGAESVFRGDMTSFALDARYDVVLCLFSSIGYVRTLEGVTRSLGRSASHLAQGGIVIVEPWFEPGAFQVGGFSIDVAKSTDVAVARAIHAEVDGRISRLRFEYLIAKSSGIERASETHELGLFTREEMLDCFAAAGLTTEYDERGLTGRGLYVARKA